MGAPSLNPGPIPDPPNRVTIDPLKLIPDGAPRSIHHVEAAPKQDQSFLDVIRPYSFAIWCAKDRGYRRRASVRRVVHLMVSLVVIPLSQIHRITDLDWYFWLNIVQLAVMVGLPICSSSGMASAPDGP